MMRTRYWLIVLPMTVIAAIIQTYIFPDAEVEMVFCICFLVCNVAGFVIFRLLGWSLKRDRRR